jgi:hypothetical protein
MHQGIEAARKLGGQKRRITFCELTSSNTVSYPFLLCDIIFEDSQTTLHVEVAKVTILTVGSGIGVRNRLELRGREASATDE